MNMKKHKARQPNKYPRAPAANEPVGIRVSYDSVRKVVVMDFQGKSIAWLALEKKAAIAFASMIMRKALELPDEENTRAEGGNTQTSVEHT